MIKPEKDELADFEQSIVDAVLDLDFALRCYYLTLSEDKKMSEQRKMRIMKQALLKGWRKTR